MVREMANTRNFLTLIQICCASARPTDYNNIVSDSAWYNLIPFRALFRFIKGSLIFLNWQILPVKKIFKATPMEVLLFPQLRG